MYSISYFKIQYACEETGLLGSRAIASLYKNQKIDVYGLLNCDMTGYHPPGNEDVGVIIDYTSADLNKFFLKVIQEYSSVKPVLYRCNFQCGG
jgi:bacterial leucyl aminopeptidase